MTAAKPKVKAHDARKTQRGEYSRSSWFKPGNPGGPGRPRKEVSDAAFGVLAENVTPDDWKQIVLRWVARAKHGDLKAIESLANRLMGLPQQPIEGGLSPETMEFLKAFYATLSPNQDGGVETSGVSADTGGPASPSLPE